MTETASTGAALPLLTRLGHCEIRQLLGQGGGGISYLAYDENLEREVVIKEHFPPSLCYRLPGTAAVQPVSAADYERSLASFCREARILAGLNHPGIVKVYDIFQASGTAYMVMEYVEGDRLTEWLPAHAGEVQLVTGVLDSLLAALEYLHSHEVLHRDIKPSNIIMRNGTQPVLIDFGAAMLGTPPTTITLVGTPGYAAPEQFHQHGKVGPWSDLYALAHSVAKLIPPLVLKRYPSRFVKALKRAGEDDIACRYSSAAAWAASLEKERGAFGWILVIMTLLLSGLVVFSACFLVSEDEVYVTGSHAGSSPQQTTGAMLLTDSPESTVQQENRSEYIKSLEEQQLQFYRNQYRATLEKSAELYGYSGKGDRDAWIEKTVEEWMRRSEGAIRDAMENYAERGL